MERTTDVPRQSRGRNPCTLDCVCLSHAARRSCTLTPERLTAGLWHEIDSRQGPVWPKKTPDELRNDVREDSCDIGRGCPAADPSAPDLRQSAFDFCKVVRSALPSFGPRFQPRRGFARRPQAVCGCHAAGFRGLHALARMGFVRTLRGVIREKPASFPPALTIE